MYVDTVQSTHTRTHSREIDGLPTPFPSTFCTLPDECSLSGSLLLHLTTLGRRKDIGTQDSAVLLFLLNLHAALHLFLPQGGMDVSGLAAGSLAHCSKLMSWE